MRMSAHVRLVRNGLPIGARPNDFDPRTRSRLARGNGEESIDDMAVKRGCFSAAGDDRVLVRGEQRTELSCRSRELVAASA